MKKRDGREHARVHSNPVRPVIVARLEAGLGRRLERAAIRVRRHVPRLVVDHGAHERRERGVEREERGVVRELVGGVAEPLGAAGGLVFI